MGNVEENTYKTKMSDQQDIFNIRKQMSSVDHEVVTVSRNIVTKPAMLSQKGTICLLLTVFKKYYVLTYRYLL